MASRFDSSVIEPTGQSGSWPPTTQYYRSSFSLNIFPFSHQVHFQVPQLTKTQRSGTHSFQAIWLTSYVSSTNRDFADPYQIAQVLRENSKVTFLCSKTQNFNVHNNCLLISSKKFLLIVNVFRPILYARNFSRGILFFFF